MKYTSKGLIQDNGEILTIEDFTRNVYLKRIEEYDLILVKILWKRRRSRDLYQNFITSNSIEKVNHLLIGENVYFGEIEGKHSEVFGDIDSEDLSFITDKKEILEFYLNYGSENSNIDFLDAVKESILEKESNEEEITNGRILEIENTYKNLIFTL